MYKYLLMNLVVTVSKLMPIITFLGNNLTSLQAPLLTGESNRVLKEIT